MLTLIPWDDPGAALHMISEILENSMGGTSGAVSTSSIFFSSWITLPADLYFVPDISSS